MASDETETTISTEYTVGIPPLVRDALELEPGDRLRWDVDDAGRLVAEVVHQRRGRAAELEPLDMGDTNAVEATENYTGP